MIRLIQQLKDITLKVEINDPTGLNNLKCKVYDLDVKR